MLIKKKIWPKYFNDIRSGKKKFELRLNDFRIKENDNLVLQEWDPKTKKYTGRELKKKVTYVSKFKPENLPFWDKKSIKKKGLQIISLK